MEKRKSGLSTRYVGAFATVVASRSIAILPAFLLTTRAAPSPQSFSSVVGPNGSGKSNVIDALLFVFGKRASKIRLKKISELIHRSKEHQNLQECRVSVHFHEIIDIEGDEDAYRVVEGSEFAVSRVATRESKSRYYVNARSSTFTEVTALLKEKKVDLDNNRFLILQGEVEQISMMKPKASNPHEDGLLEYLEDLIGSNQYVDAIEEKHKQVEALNETRQEKFNRVKLVEKEMQGLEGAKSEAEAYLVKENERDCLSAQVFQINEAKAKREASIARANEARVRENLERERAKLGEKTKDLSNMEAEYKQKKAEYDATEGVMLKTKEEFAAFERKDIQYQENLKNEKAKRKKAEAKVRRQRANIKRFEQQYEDETAHKPRIEKEIKKLEASKAAESAEMERMFEQVKGKTEHHRVKMEAKETELVPLRKKINDIKKKKTIAQSELKLLTDKSDRAQKQLQAAQQAEQELAENIKSNERSLQSSTAEHNKVVVELKAKQSELAEVEEEVRVNTKKYNRVRQECHETKARQAQAKSQGAVLSGLLKARRQGVIPGIQGRLGDLGAIDEKYDVAISTACPALNHIVVDTTQTAEKCVRFLRKKNLGRATFVILEKQSRWTKAIQKPFKAPQGAERLFDLVRVRDAKHKPAFYFALRDTLVAANLEAASQIGYNQARRWRVVTLSGELIDSSGTMSGGGKRVARGGMRANFAASQAAAGVLDLHDKEAEVARLERSLPKLKVRQQALREEVDALKRRESKIQVTMRKLEMDVSALRAQTKGKVKQVAALRAAAKPDGKDAARVKELKREIAAAQNRLDKSEAATNALQAQVDALQAKIMAAGGAQLREQNAKVETLSKQLDAANKRLTQANVTCESNVKKIAKAKKDLATAEADVEECNKTVAAAKAQFKQIEEDAFQVVKAYKAAQKQLKERAKELETIQKQYEVFKTQVNAIRKAEVDIVNEMEGFQRAAEEAHAKATSWSKQIDAIAIKINASLLHEVAGEADPAMKRASETKDASADEKVGDDEKVPAGPSMEVDGDEDAGPSAATDVKGTAPRAKAFSRLSDDEVAGLNKKRIQDEITVLEEALAQMKPDMRAISEYKQKHKEYMQRVGQLDAITVQRNTARKVYDGLRKKRLDEFMAGFTQITMKLKEMYQMLTLGGDAELELVDSLDPFSEGIVFSVRPPKKSWKNIHNLSGGEKTLSSLALIFALHHFKPTPLYVMDEIDAALDFKNVSIVANYIKERTKNAQFIIISLRNNMFELADRLVGIYKTHDVTKSITIDPRKFSVPSAVAQAARAKASKVPPAVRARGTRAIVQ